jgi:hypothetical protein
VGVLFAVGAVTTYGAAAPEVFWTKCQLGTGPGQCSLPRGVGVDGTSGPSRGHVYVADQDSHRILEFSAWGEFIKAWGWDVAPEGAPGDTGGDQLETCTQICQAGVNGPGSGQVSTPQGIAVDSNGDIYVVDFGTHRVQKFSPEGEFILMFGGEVNKTKSEELGSTEAERNLCTAASGDVCQAGTQGAGAGQFGSWVGGSYIADSPGPPERIYVGDQGRIQVFDTEGHYVGDFPDPEGLLGGKTVFGLASRAAGGLYVIRGGTANVLALDGGGHKACTATVSDPRSVVEGAGGSFYVLNNLPGSGVESVQPRILEFDAGCNRTTVPDFGQDALTGDTPEGLGWGSACFAGGSGLYVGNSDPLTPFLRAYSPTPDPTLCPPPRVAPEIKAQYAISVRRSEATVGASINAHYFTADAGTTTYKVQYGSAACIEAEGWAGSCVKVAPGGEAAELGGGPSDNPLPSAGIFLGGLQPATAYRYRFVVEARDGEGVPVVAGQPVIGRGGKPGLEGEAGTFTTFPPAEAIPSCANDGFRGGAAAALPDCRAYEMVSPIDKEGGDILARVSASTGIGRLDQSAAEVPAGGVGITYSSYRAFGGAQSAPFSSQYLSRRHPLGSLGEGWSSEPISPPQEGEFFPHTSFSMINNGYHLFSADLSEGWLATYTEPVLGVGGQAGFANIYRRDLLSGDYEACTTESPQGGDGDTRAYEAEMQGVSEDGGRAVFRANDKLTEDANEPPVAGKATNFQVYACDRKDVGSRGLHLMSKLPNGTASTAKYNTVGVANSKEAEDGGRVATLTGALAADGERIYWTATSGEFGPGALYVRLNPGAEESSGKDGEGHCVPEAGKACTLAVSPGQPARFWGAARDGSRALFSIEAESGQEPQPSDLYEFDLAEAEAGGEAKTLIAHESLGVLGFSEGASRVYFVSKADLDGAGSASAGQPNLYLYEAGAEPTYAFIGPLSAADVASHPKDPSAAHSWALLRQARVSEDGGTLVFAANSAALAGQVGYDNTDVASGEADTEVYRYSAAGEGLACISCRQSGARPAGQAVTTLASSPPFWQAARIPGQTTSLYPGRVIADGGRRVFFESFDALVLADANGKADVYEWEQAGEGGCQATSAAFAASAGGCVYLISSGTSDADSEFVDASADGKDVFIRTAQNLLPQDPGLFDIYDARVEGGFPPPPAPPGECEGEACHNPAGPPQDQSPASSGFSGKGNLSEGAPSKQRCPKGKRRVAASGKKKARCVAKKKSHSKRAPGNHGRAAR